MTFENIDNEEETNRLPEIMLTEGSSFAYNSHKAPSQYENSEQKDYIFFDLIKDNVENFVRLTGIKIFYDYKQFTVERKDNSILA